MFSYSDKLKTTHCLLDNFENKMKRKSSCRSEKKLQRPGDDKRSRREVANNNERRRMQSINAGFENLKKLLPLCNDMEKISKATILQTTAKYIGDLQLKINSLENDMSRLRNFEKMISNGKTVLIDSLKSNEVYQNVDSGKSSTNERNGDTESSVSEPGSSLSLSMTDNLSSKMINYNSEDEMLIGKNQPSCPSVVVGDMTTDITRRQQQQQHQNNLQQLLAAVEQVERLEALQTTISLSKDLTCFSTSNSSSSNKINKSESVLYSLASSCSCSCSSCSSLDTTSTSHLVVMKPTISPFAEKLIQDVVNMHHQTQQQHQQSYSQMVTTSIDGSTVSVFPSKKHCSILTTPITTTKKNRAKSSFISKPTVLQRNDIFSQKFVHND